MKKQVLILGGGITGLALGFYLRERFGEGINLLILEQSDRFGGWIQTLSHPPFLFEIGPRTLRTKGAGVETLRLVESLGLKSGLIFPDKGAEIRYILHEGVIEKVPASLSEFFRSPLLKGKKRAILKGLFLPGGKKEDESIASFASRRFSKSVADDLFAPLTLGIFGGDIETLSLRSCFPSLYKHDQRPLPFLLSSLLEKRSFTKQAYSPPFFSFKEGLEEIPKTLARKLEKDLVPRCRVMGLSLREMKAVIQTNQGPFVADHIFSTLPAATIGRWFKNPLFDRLPMKSVGVVHLGWMGKRLPLPGFGYLVPRSNILGVVFDSNAFPQQTSVATTRLTVMMREPSLRGALQHINKFLKIGDSPDFFHETLAKDAIPQYPPGFHKIQDALYDQIKKEAPFLTLLGTSFKGVSVNECISSAREAAAAYDPST